MCAKLDDIRGIVTVCCIQVATMLSSVPDEVVAKLADRQISTSFAGCYRHIKWGHYTATDDSSCFSQIQTCAVSCRTCISTLTSVFIFAKNEYS